MRTAFIGSNSLTVTTAELLLADGHAVVIVERDRERIDELAERLDAGFVHGDGTSPDVLRDAEPENTDVLFCLLESDQTNILAALIGRSLGFARVVPRVNERQFQHIADELGLTDTVLPNQAVASHLRNLLGGEKSLELSSVIRDDAAVFSFFAGPDEAGPVDALELPERTRIVCLYRDERFRLPAETRRIRDGDEIILICAREQLDMLHRRWGAPNGESD
jgi:trk system potassium uptake protein TrkA